MPSLVGKLWIGRCPECLNPEMLANTSDYYECPKCHLQICIAGEVHIIPKKGNGEFRRARRDGYISAVDQLPLGVDLEIKADYR